MEQPFILCGLGRVGWRVLEYLQAAGLPVIVVDTRCSPNDARLKGAGLVHGDCRRPEVLDEAGVRQARGILIMTNDDLMNISTALAARHANQDARIVMRMFNENMIPRMGKAFHNTFALSTSSLTAPVFASAALTGQALGAIRIHEGKNGLRQLAEMPITVDSPWRGQAVAAVANSQALQVAAHFPAGGKERCLLDVDPDARLAEGDRLIVCGEPRNLGPLINGEDPSLEIVHWAGWLRRMSRVLWRTLFEIDLSVKISGAVLLAVVLISTLVLRSSIQAYDTEHALFRTISILATGADMHGEELKGPGLKFFAATLRILGAALIAAFTAIFTNYLLRARLSGALEFRRIPDSGHIVICGLGNIGFRVVEELVRCGERVVVIEQDKDSRFVTTARRLGVPVLIGDATISTVLQQAHATRARAVVAATSEDLINLEVALMARELNSAQRVVLHLSDPDLARMLRENANVKLALSIPVLAAPAFVAALFGDRVQSVFMINGRLLAGFELVILPEDPRLIGQPVQSVAVVYRLLPIAVLDGQGICLPEPLTVRLESGFRLIAVSALPDLERLLRRNVESGRD